MRPGNKFIVFTSRRSEASYDVIGGPTRHVKPSAPLHTPQRLRRSRPTFPTIAKPELTPNKLMLCIWWDWKGIIELIPSDEIFNSDIYLPPSADETRLLISKFFTIHVGFPLPEASRTMSYLAPPSFTGINGDFGCDDDFHFLQDSLLPPTLVHRTVTNIGSYGRKLVSHWILHLSKKQKQLMLIGACLLCKGGKSKAVSNIVPDDLKPIPEVRSRSISKKVVASFISNKEHVAIFPLQEHRTDG
ncbi:hypothetical protein EVAR_90904_1 [Eumeta japonica]|uniref:Uncharacterized protein n=1 Tax=Eumeta variegata TaxID=151549 RepID=A0A4C2A3V1_EUMVA|nr:hypothetical protein EVAR_90904_1 [Eumeta japonica]